MGKLAQFFFLQHLQQFRLPHQDKLQHQALVNINVGQHPDVFKCIGTQVLCLIDYQQDSATCPVLPGNKIDKDLLKLYMVSLIGVDLVSQ